MNDLTAGLHLMQVLHKKQAELDGYRGTGADWAAVAQAAKEMYAPRWTAITSDPSTWPPEGHIVFVIQFDPENRPKVARWLAFSHENGPFPEGTTTFCHPISAWIGSYYTYITPPIII